MSAEDAINMIRRQLDRRLDAAAILLTGAVKEAINEPVPRVPSKNAGYKSLKKYGMMAENQFNKHGAPPGARLVSQIFTPKRFGQAGGQYTTTAGKNIYAWYRKSKGKGAGSYVKVLRATRGAPPRKFEGRLRSSMTWERPNWYTRRVGTNVKYARKLEFEGHPYFFSALAKVRSKIEALLGQDI